MCNAEELMDLKDILKSRFHCPDALAEDVQLYLEKIEPPLLKILDRWCEKESDIDDQIEVEGYTIAKLMQDYDLKFPGALLTLDGLMKQPAITKQALENGVCL